jgi:peptidoglycan pentaglycine glycine transferase (the first glycine)
MILKEIKEDKIWESFLQSVSKKTFLHSWVWGQFQEALGEKIWRFGIYENAKLFGLAFVVKVSARRGNFLFIPHGPIITNLEEEIGNEKFEAMHALISELRELARQEQCSFIRISPVFEDTQEHCTLFKQFGFRSAPMHMHAELTWLLDVSKAENELLQEMRKTTRNLVRRGEKEEISVKKGTLDEFYPLFEQTAQRQHFVKFSKKYLKQELKVFGKNAQIFLATHDGQLLAGALVVFYDDTAYYHHAASTHSKIPGAYSLQWAIIKEAKKRKIIWYNFWGVVPESDTRHPWWGLSLFKRGFGGKEWPLMHAQDLPLSFTYWFSWTIETIRSKKRGY